MKHNWFQNAFFYSLDVETFYDSNGDGIGDFQGLINKLDYLAGLGITCIWLLPFFPSPNRDNGYDVIDYYSVDERLGDLGDFAEFMDKANAYGIKIIIDLVINHTSIEHPWFQKARKDRNSKFHDFYVWSDNPVKFKVKELNFKGEEETMWTYDKKAKRYYLHRFYKEQPDLNIMNPDVRKEILKIMGFWLHLGVSGFRVDAAAIIIEPYGIKGAEKEEMEKFLDEMRHFLTCKNPEAILLAEANVPPKETGTYMKGKERMHMMFNFHSNQHLFLSLAQKKAAPLIKAIKKLPPALPFGQWLNFLRHHDELSISLLTEKQQQEVFERFGPEPDMQIYESGIRRRLAPMLNGNIDLIKFCYSILVSLPGVPVIRYGDEIAMGDDLSLEGRESVRTPMQWTRQKNAGFSKAEKSSVIHKIIDWGDYNYEKVNVLDAQSDHNSLLNWIEQLISIRKQCPEIGAGTLEIAEVDEPGIFIHKLESEHGKLLFIHNFSEKVITVNYKLLDKKSNWVHIFGNTAAGKNNESIEVGVHGFHWWRLLD
ncbi:MAG TPA: alpha-amylase family protein [Bacteroidia bacterium]|nr:alpha-amylase family protein [Bacteroidia bacterium]